MPRFTSAESTPDKLTATRCPATASSTSWPCTCSPRTRTSIPEGHSCRREPLLRVPLHIEPVTTVPKPGFTKTRSIGRRRRAFLSRTDEEPSSRPSVIFSSSKPAPVLEETVTMGAVPQRVSLRKSLSSSFTSSRNSASTRSALVMTTSPCGVRSSSKISTCSLVWGITPSWASTTSRPTS